MQTRALGVIVTASVVMTSPTAAQGRLFNVPQLAQPAPYSGSQTQPFGPSRRPQQKPLFPLPDLSRKVAAMTVTCGRVIPATPEIDPKILRTVPDDGITYTMRKVPAPPCVVPNVPPPTPGPADAR